MARATHKWAFKPGMRAGAYSWRSSTKAIDRLKLVSSEIRAVARVDPVMAAEGVIALAQRIWPAFEHIDTSSGALGNAVRRTLEELLPVLIEAPADEKTRAKWLEQLREAIEDDGGSSDFCTHAARQLPRYSLHIGYHLGSRCVRQRFRKYAHRNCGYGAVKRVHDRCTKTYDAFSDLLVVATKPK